MRRLLILGAGTAGTMVANKLRHRLDRHSWDVTVVDPQANHLYQPGLLLLPFGVSSPEELLRPRAATLADGVWWVRDAVDRVDPVSNVVHLEDGRQLDYDYLVIATGTTPRPDQTPGMDGRLWRTSIFDFYTLAGATALREALADFEGGRLVVQVVEMPIKCPVAPLEFIFLADAFFHEKGIRDRVELTYVTPLEGAFTKPVASARLAGMLDQRNIALESDFVIERVDADARAVVSMDERVIPFDLLVTVPLNMGADFIERSGLGDDLNYVPVDRGTLQATGHPNVFALGDASNIPASKAGSVAHFSVELFTDNFLQLINAKPMTHLFDGHANCFVESGNGKGMLIDFNYETEPLPGKYPLPGIGPFSLLEETHLNHLGKIGFRWAYWHLLLPGHPLPVPALMSMTGKRPVEKEES